MTEVKRPDQCEDKNNNNGAKFSAWASTTLKLKQKPKQLLDTSVIHGTIIVVRFIFIFLQVNKVTEVTS